MKEAIKATITLRLKTSIRVFVYFWLFLSLGIIIHFIQLYFSFNLHDFGRFDEILFMLVAIGYGFFDMVHLIMFIKRYKKMYEETVSLSFDEFGVKTWHVYGVFINYFGIFSYFLYVLSAKFNNMTQ